MVRRWRRRIARPVWALLGALALGAGAIGVVLPLLPTTPFVILAAFAFDRSSPRVHAALLGNRITGPIIRDWRASGAIAPRFKAIAVAMMLAVLAGSLIAGFPAFVVGLQAVVLALAAAFVLSRPNGH